MAKPFNRCTYDEIIVELWEQLYTSNHFTIYYNKNNGYSMEKSMVYKMVSYVAIIFL